MSGYNETCDVIDGKRDMRTRGAELQVVNGCLIVQTACAFISELGRLSLFSCNFTGFC